MFEIRHFITPRTLEEAYAALIAHRKNRLLGGCMFLKMGHKLINTGIDLCELGLDKISRSEGWIDIGATCTYGDLAGSSLLQEFAGGLIPRALLPVVGIQLRNGVQVGASVFSKFGFSDFIPALLAVGAEVTLYQAGRMALADFLDRPLSRDILVAVHLPDHKYVAACQSLRVTASDLPVINCAVAKDLSTGTWRIAAGALPSRARLVPAAAGLLADREQTGQGLADVTIDEACAILRESLPFGSNARASRDYRQAMAGVLLGRALREIKEVCK